MIDEIIDALQQIAQSLVNAPVVIGSMPPLNGYAVCAAGGRPVETFRNLTANMDIPVLFNGKGADQQMLAQSMDAVHLCLTTSKNLPYTDKWQIYAIETTSAPNLVGREENQNWVYGSSFNVKLYLKGVNNA